MTIRLIAMDLYRLIREVEALEKKFEDAPYDRKEKFKFELIKLRAERDRLRRMLEGNKG